MRRITFDLKTAGVSLGVVLLAVGGLLLWGSSYIHNQVTSQLSAQKVFFPPAAAFAHPKAGTEITPSMIPSVSQYAGQQMVTGQQAEAYANDFIAVHLAEIGGGKTYAQLSALSMANPKNAALAGQVAAVFKGDALRAMLLNAFGWWKVSQIAYIAALVSFGLGAVGFVAGVFSIAFGRREHPVLDARQHEAIPAACGRAGQDDNSIHTVNLRPAAALRRPPAGPLTAAARQDSR